MIGLSAPQRGDGDVRREDIQEVEIFFVLVHDRGEGQVRILLFVRVVENALSDAMKFPKEEFPLHGSRQHLPETLGVEQQWMFERESGPPGMANFSPEQAPLQGVNAVDHAAAIKPQ